MPNFTPEPHPGIASGPLKADPFGQQSLGIFAGLNDPIARLRMAGLFGGSGGKPQYTAKDVLDAQREAAKQFDQPIQPVYRGIMGGGLAAFGNPFVKMMMLGDARNRSDANEQVRRDATERAAGATTFDEWRRAMASGSPEMGTAAATTQGQQLVKEQERQRQAAIAQQVYGTPGGATVPSASAPAGPDAVVQGAQQAQAQNNGAGAWQTETAPSDEALLPFPLPPISPPSSAPPQPPAQLQGMPPTLMREATLPAPPAAAAQSASQAPVLSSGIPPASQAAPGAQPPTSQQLPQQDPIVQIGQIRVPLSEAKRRLAYGYSSGMGKDTLKVLEDAIELAEAPIKAAEQERGKMLGTAQANLPQAMEAAQGLIGNLDWLLNNPDEVGRVTGQVQGSQWYDEPGSFSPLAYAPEYSTLFGGTSRAGIKERIRQVTGQSFVQAFQTIKGAGPISDQEGKAASAAITRLEKRDQSDAEFMQAVTDARRKIWDLANVARAKAGPPAIPYQPHASEVRQGGGRPQQSGAAAPGNYMWTPDGGLQRR